MHLQTLLPERAAALDPHVHGGQQPFLAGTDGSRHPFEVGLRRNSRTLSAAQGHFEDYRQFLESFQAGPAHDRYDLPVSFPSYSGGWFGKARGIPRWSGPEVPRASKLDRYVLPTRYLH